MNLVLLIKTDYVELFLQPGSVFIARDPAAGRVWEQSGEQPQANKEINLHFNAWCQFQLLSPTILHLAKVKVQILSLFFQQFCKFKFQNIFKMTSKYSI